jgi:lysophospholipase L1-like esterase
MSSRRFIITALLISFFILISIAAVNYFVDPYGLFHNTKNRKIEVQANERTSKYLLTYRYIPENFEGFIIGPSLSANLNPEEIKDYRVYNASIMGANISDLHYLITNMVERGKMRFAIVCLDPYLTKDHGKKSAMIDPKEYYGALGSYNLFSTYAIQYIRDNNLMPRQLPKGLINAYGYNNFNLAMQGNDAKKMILEKVQNRSSEPIVIDTAAVRELDETLQFMREHKIKVIGYFSPVPYEIYQLHRAKYVSFQRIIGGLFKDEDVLLDLNLPEYETFTKDYNTYADHGHLSYKGQKFVLGELHKVLLKNVQPAIVAAQ